MKNLFPTFRLKHILFILFSFLLVVFSSTPVSGTVIQGYPDWVGGKRDLKIFIPSGADDDFVQAVEDAIEAWNDANDGENSWTLETTSDSTQADIVIQEGDPGGGDTGGATVSGTDAGITRVAVLIKPDMDEEEALRTIMHELGHCLRLEHTSGDDHEDDVMFFEPNNPNTATTPSTNDASEATASDRGATTEAESDTSVNPGDEDQSITFFPKPGTGITFADVVDINISSLTGADFFIDDASISWDLSSISALITVSMTADHNEVYNIEVIRDNGNIDNYTGILFVAPDPAPSGLPHAVAGDDIIVAAGQAVFLDGSASYHDSPGAFIAGNWFIPSAGTGLFQEYGQLFLPQGTYEAILTVTDYYGRSSIGSLTIVVGGPDNPIPTLSEWGIILFALLLLAFGIVFVRRQQLALGGGEVSGDIKHSWLTNKMLRKLPLVLLAVVPIVSALIFMVYGEITTLDISGILLSSIILAYIYLFLRLDKNE